MKCSVREVTYFQLNLRTDVVVRNGIWYDIFHHYKNWDIKQKTRKDSEDKDKSKT